MNTNNTFTVVTMSGMVFVSFLLVVKWIMGFGLRLVEIKGGAWWWPRMVEGSWLVKPAKATSQDKLNLVGIAFISLVVSLILLIINFDLGIL